MFCSATKLALFYGYVTCGHLNKTCLWNFLPAIRLQAERNFMGKNKKKHQP